VKDCDICQVPNQTRTAVVCNKYYKNVCQRCLTPTINSGHARWSRTIDMEDHEQDVQQPYNKDGSVNVKFAQMYPEQAKAVFSQEQIDSAVRK